MKIIIISTPFVPSPPPTYGGLELITYNLAVELANRGHQVALACPSESKLPSNVTHVDIGPARYKVHQDWYQAELQAYQKYKPYLKDYDIIHDHTWFAFPYLYKQENPEAKIIHTHHGACNWTDALGNPKPPPVLYPNLVGISRSHAESLSLFLGRPLRYVYNGIDTTLYPYQKDKEDYLLFLSRITPIKGAHIAIEVAKKLRQKLIIAGGDIFVEDQAYVTHVIEQCDGHLIKYKGEVSFQEKIELLKNAKALLFCPNPPFQEPFGLVPVEAMLCGTPVISLRNGATPEIIKHGYSGYICHSPEEIVKAVNKIEKIKPKNCRKWALQFSKENMTTKYEQLYKEVIDGIEW